jgi:hypothetical protein
MLALALPADAKIIYTATHKSIRPNHSLKLDLNHDGITDFSIADRLTGGTCTTSICNRYNGTLAAQPATGIGVQGFVFSGRPWARAVKAGARVGASRYFDGINLAVVTGYPYAESYRYGSWVDVKNRYLGLKFKIEGKIHYGWARLSVTVGKFHITGILTGYAYETIPGKAIVTGKRQGSGKGQPENVSESPTLGSLAAGATELSTQRDRVGLR